MEPFAPLPPTPTDPVPATRPALAGRTASKASALRAGLVLGTALVLVVGAAVTMGAAAGPSTVGAGPVAAASGSPAPAKGPKGNGFGHGGFGGNGPGAGGFGPFAGGFGPFGADGKPGKGLGRGFAQITIEAIDGSKLSLATDDGWTRTIAITGATTITRGGAAATAADLHVGDHIRFRQEKAADGTFTITAVEVVLPEVVGTIAKVDGSTLTLTDRDGATVTVHLGATTAIRVRGLDNATAKDLAAGQVVVVVGEQRSDASIDATSVASGKLREPKADHPKDDPDESEAPEASGQGG